MASFGDMDDNTNAGERSYKKRRGIHTRHKNAKTTETLEANERQLESHTSPEHVVLKRKLKDDENKLLNASGSSFKSSTSVPALPAHEAPPSYVAASSLPSVTSGKSALQAYRVPSIAQRLGPDLKWERIDLNEYVDENHDTSADSTLADLSSVTYDQPAPAAPTPAAATDSATNRFFGIVEMRELVFALSEPADIVVFQRINRCCRATVEETLALQKAICMQPSASKPNILQHLPRWMKLVEQPTPENSRNAVLCVADSGRRGSHTRIESVLDNKQASFRKMHFTQGDIPHAQYWIRDGLRWRQTHTYRYLTGEELIENLLQAYQVYHQIGGAVFWEVLISLDGTPQDVLKRSILDVDEEKLAQKLVAGWPTVALQARQCNFHMRRADT